MPVIQGSSPRVWGQVACHYILLNIVRIIPTRMGTRAIAPDNALGCKDHPHAYGDKILFHKFLILSPGSSPRVWGQVNRYVFRVKINRIIPTRMGTSFLVFCSKIFTKDHPHAYGDKRRKSLTSPSTLGSSPRVWGQGSFYSCRHSVRGIIPTRMGTRPLYTVCCKTSLDHPHAYGDKVCENYYVGDGVGSSPRVWGQDQQILYKSYERRIIPTRMGTRI